jgi:hypothetical protein
MRRDIPYLMKADMVCLLEGWIDSQGAQLEKDISQRLGIPVFSKAFLEQTTKQLLQVVMGKVQINKA